MIIRPQDPRASIQGAPPIRRAPLVLACVFPLAIAACHPDAKAPESTSTATSPGLEAANPAQLPDSDVAQAIERHFHEEGLLRSEPLHVAVTQGVAMLSGSVHDLMAKERAVRVAESIRGVRSVVDQVTVAPVVRTDQQLEGDVSRALRRDLATRSYAIAVAAKNATVTLTGSADSWQEKRLFADVAETVPGVKALDNAVVVRYAALRSEEEIASDVNYRIANDASLDGDMLGTTVATRTVHLSGVVASVAQKRRARSDAWVSGVEAVDDDGVTVDWRARDDERPMTGYPFKLDTEIDQAVRAAFLLDPRLKTLMPQVAVQNGLVVLNGTVDSPKARQAAEGDARDTVGVWSVRDDVLVQPEGRFADADVEHGVERALADDRSLSDGKSIHVASVKGKVALTGTVPSGVERLDAVADARRAVGVDEVDDDLVVNRSPAEIKASIGDRLSWDPRVPRDAVRVEVSPDGVATMTGTLDTWSAIIAAADDALSGGPARVINLLKLKNHPEVTAP